MKHPHVGERESGKPVKPLGKEFRVVRHKEGVRKEAAMMMKTNFMESDATPRAGTSVTDLSRNGKHVYLSLPLRN
jgi:hypothetical protein